MSHDFRPLGVQRPVSIVSERESCRDATGFVATNADDPSACHSSAGRDTLHVRGHRPPVAVAAPGRQPADEYDAVVRSSHGAIRSYLVAVARAPRTVFRQRGVMSARPMHPDIPSLPAKSSRRHPQALPSEELDVLRLAARLGDVDNLSLARYVRRLESRLAAIDDVLNEFARRVPPVGNTSVA